MPSIAYGSGAYRRDNGALPELKCVNMFVEQVKTAEQGISLLSRQGLALQSTVGAGPVQGIYCHAGVLGGSVFTVSAGSLYRDGALLGAIDGSGPVRFAGSATELVVTRGGSAWSYNGTNLAAIAFPNGYSVIDVAYIGSLFVFIPGGLQKFYWSALLDARTIDALNYASAEREPDQLLGIEALGDNIWLMGQATLEAWAHTGDSLLPFTRFEQVAPDKGLRATGCDATADNTIYFVGSDSRVYRITDSSPQRVSNHGVEERISASVACSAFSYIFEGHEQVCIRLDNTTLAIDAATGEWNEHQTGTGNWIAACATMVGDKPRFGHASDGSVMSFGGWTDLGTAMPREFSAAQQLDKPLILSRVRLWLNSGAAVVLSGNGYDPQIEMRTSRDAGRTWGAWSAQSAGQQGNYRAIAEWRRCGMFDFPGIVLHFRMTDPAPLRISAVKINDVGGGRSRG